MKVHVDQLADESLLYVAASDDLLRFAFQSVSELLARRGFHDRLNDVWTELESRRVFRPINRSVSVVYSRSEQFESECERAQLRLSRAGMGKAESRELVLTLLHEAEDTGHPDLGANLVELCKGFYKWQMYGLRPWMVNEELVDADVEGSGSTGEFSSFRLHGLREKGAARARGINRKRPAEEANLVNFDKAATSRKVFVSHASGDKAVATLFVEKLLQLGLGIARKDIFYSSRSGSIGGGQGWFDEIVNQLKDGPAVICLITPSFLKSDFCLLESGAGIANGTLLPVLLRGSRGAFGQTQTYGADDEWLPQLADDLARLLSIRVDSAAWSRAQREFLGEFELLLDSAQTSTGPHIEEREKVATAVFERRDKIVAVLLPLMTSTEVPTGPADNLDQDCAASKLTIELGAAKFADVEAELLTFLDSHGDLMGAVLDREAGRAEKALTSYNEKANDLAVRLIRVPPA